MRQNIGKQNYKKMFKVAIFVEGQTEQIFIKELLYQIFGYQSLKVSNVRKRGKNIFLTLEREEDSTEHHDYEFLLVDVGNDEKVTSAVLENVANMSREGFQKVLGLRDLYPNNRDQEAEIRRSIDRIVNRSSQSKRMKIFLAIMETEAWFLADPNLFQKINHKLTKEYILSELEYDLENIDPQIYFNHPAKIINDIYQLADLKYQKRKGDCYKIAKNLDYNYLYLDARETNKISSFFQFADELTSLR